MKEGRNITWSYMACDLLSTALAIYLFNIIRYYRTWTLLHEYGALSNFMGSTGVVLSLTVFAPGMLLIYALSGFYIYRRARSRTDVFLVTMATAFVGTLIYFFTALLNDANVAGRMYNYELVAILFGLLFLLVFIPRWLITTHEVNLVHSRKKWLNTLIIGTSREAVKFEKELREMPRSMGFRVVAFIDTGCDKKDQKSSLPLPVYGLDEIDEVVKREDIKSLVMVFSREGRRLSMQVINRLFPLELPMFLSPDRYQMMLAHGRFSNIAGEPLIDISRSDRSTSVLAIKRAFDLIISGIALTLSLPIIGVLALVIKAQSPGPVFYRQERIGYRKRKFRICKMRSMRTDAEQSGPKLSSVNDPRITPVGAFMRKYRLDELPNFWNVLRGDMSVVGPRPEREHFIREIVKKAPYYTLLHQVRPGITSWGMVKYGYASSVDQMVERLKYDMAYLENFSISVDIKIMFYTIRTVVTGRGI